MILKKGGKCSYSSTNGATCACLPGFSGPLCQNGQITTPNTNNPCNCINGNQKNLF